MRVWLGLLLVVGGCGFPKLPALYDAMPEDAADDGGAGDGRTEVARVPVMLERDVDILFLIDDSPSMLDKQTNLKNAFPAFVNELSTLEGGLPNVHIGVATSDLGAKGADDAQAGPGIGSGPGSCMSLGKNGNLQTNGSTLVQGTFISDTRNTDGSRAVNYTGSLSGAFSSIASVGAAGCGFEQPLQAIKAALANNPANAGFLRSNAGLAVIVLSDEDDCSMAHSSLMAPDMTLGQLQSFRCTRYGVKCDIGGTTPDEMNMTGVKGSCRADDGSAYLTKVGDYVTFLKSLKPDPTRIMFGAMVAPATPFEVELRAPPGSNTPIPALKRSCMYDGANGLEVGDPAVRLQQVASSFTRNYSTSVCSADLSTAMTEIGRRVRGLVGDPCLVTEIAQPADCVVVEVSGSTEKTLPQCSGTVATNCYKLVEDSAQCSTPSHLRLEIVRSEAPPANAVVVARCRL